MKTDDYVAERRAGFRGFAPLAAAAVALLSVSCATQVGKESAAFEGGPASAVLEEHGDPGFRHRDNDGVTYMAYRLPLPPPWTNGATSARCSVIYTVRADTVLASDLVGSMCHEARRSTPWSRSGVKKLADDLEGKGIRDLLLVFGAPDYGGLADGNGTLVYDYGEESGSVAEDVGGGASVAIGFSLGCVMTIVIEDAQVAGAELEGGMCWATSI